MQMTFFLVNMRIFFLKITTEQQETLGTITAIYVNTVMHVCIPVNNDHIKTYMYMDYDWLKDHRKFSKPTLSCKIDENRVSVFKKVEKSDLCNFSFLTNSLV